MALNKVLKVNSDSELLSYIINVTPELSSEIDLPTQGQDLKPIGRLIVNNQRLKNAFINTVNMIGLTIIDRNYWENPWKGFTERGVINFGDSVREIAVDIADVFDYNEYVNSATHFLETVNPNVYNFIHELNYQKFYKTTTSDEQIAMAFIREGDLMGLIEEIISSLYKGYEYDNYIINKYMLCRRLVDGTITVKEVENFENLTPRQTVAFIKNVSNLMTFMSPNYNPAGLRRSTSFDKQIAIINTDFDATLTTEVLATSFFRNDAEMKTRMALIDGYGNHDTARLVEVLGTQYIPFTSEEISTLNKIMCTIIDDEWYQNYTYSLDNQAEPNGAMGDGQTRATSLFNQETLKNTHWLHTWKVMSTSPFKNAVSFIKDVTPAVTSVTISPSESSVSAGIPVQLTAVVETTGFANKAVQWSIDEAPGQQEGSPVTIDNNGLVTIPSNYTPTTTDPGEPNPIVIKATSIFDPEKSNTATITVL